jgi:tRNA splicing endonuclease
LGETHIPTTVLPATELIARTAEADENEKRLSLCPSEQVQVARFYEEQDRQEAAFRKQEHGGTAPGRKAQNTSEDSSPVSEKGKSRVKTAKRAGTSFDTLKKAEQVVVAADGRALE